MEMTKIVREAINLEQINKLAFCDLPLLKKDVELKFDSQINSIATDIVFENSSVHMIFLSGPSSSGKTTGAKRIAKALGMYGVSAKIVSLDNFYMDHDKIPFLPDGTQDFEDISTLDLDVMLECFDEISRKGAAKFPIFDFLTGTRSSEIETITLSDNELLIVEGIHALNPIFGNVVSSENMYKVYICLNTDFTNGNDVLIPAKKLRLMRRIIRDYRTRAATAHKTLQMWDSVCRGEELYIKPYRYDVNATINSAHAYEPLLYRNYLEPILRQEEQGELLGEIKELIDMISGCVSLEKDILPEDSLLHEFIG